jgi:hypothetical protein
MKTLASCTVQPRLSCMLHSASFDDLLQVADLSPVALRGLLAWALRPDKSASRPALGRRRSRNFTQEVP